MYERYNTNMNGCLRADTYQDTQWHKKNKTRTKFSIRT